MSKARKIKNSDLCLREISLGSSHAKDIGFPGVRNDGDGDLTRFIARWRLAANFTSVEICGFNAKTVSGYTGIIKLVLAVNAAEQFARCLGIDQGSLVHLESTLSFSKNNIKWSKNLARILEMLDAHLTGSNLKRRISNCLEKKIFDLWGFSFGIRHVFAHGILTAGANDADPATVGSLCSDVADLMLDSLEEYFSSAVESFQNKCN
jgi:hypothetical protein